jgi:hypothetical protein
MSTLKAHLALQIQKYIKKTNDAINDDATIVVVIAIAAC